MCVTKMFLPHSPNKSITVERITNLTWVLVHGGSCSRESSDTRNGLACTKAGVSPLQGERGGFDSLQVHMGQ